MKKIVTMAIFLIVQHITAQVQLSGIVKDTEGNTLEMANLIAINTQTKKLDSYGFTDAFGNYKLNLKKNASYTIKVSYVGMKTAEIALNSKEKNIVKQIVLEIDNTLGEVEIIAKMPVRVVGDTIVYNADSFKNGTEKKLGDVLEKLPGVEVNDEGEIKVEGKTVKKVMVEGKDFFDGDSKLATKNIPANAVDKVQVLKNHNEVRQMSSITDNEDNVVINIKLKEGKKRFWFGEITAGAGILRKDERYLVHPKLFYYSPTGSVNIITDINNIGKVPFTRRDYFKFSGGFRYFGGRGTNFNVSSSDIGFLTMKNNKAKEIEAKFGAVNFSYSLSKTWDISGFAIYSGNKTTMQDNTIRNYINPEKNIVNTSSTLKKVIKTETNQSLTSQKSDLGLLKLSSSYKPNANNQLDYDFFAETSKQNQKQIFQSNRVYVNAASEQIPIHELTQQNPYSIQQNLNYYYTLDDKNIFALEGQYLLQNEDPFYNAQLEKLSFANQLGLILGQSLYNVSQNKRVKTNKLDAKLDYFYVLNSKSHLNITLGTTLSKQQFNSDIFETLVNKKQKKLTNANSINKVDFYFDDYFTGLHYKFITGIFTFEQGVTLHKYTAKNTQLATTVNNNFTKLLPDASVKIALKKSENIRLRYSKQVSFTDVNKVAKGYVFNNYNRLYSGNRNLENARSHNFNLSYFSFNMFNYTNMFAYVNYSKRINAVKGLTEFDGVDQKSTSINSAFPDETWSGNVNWGKRFRKFKLRLGGNLSYSKSNNLFYSPQTKTTINQESNSFIQSYNTRFSSNFKDAPNFDIGYAVSINKYNQAQRTNTYTTHSPFAKLETFITDELIFNTKYTYNNYQSDGETINNYSFWDADLSYQKKDSKWEYIIEATNLLNTRSLNRDSSGVIFNSTSQYVIQPRFVTLSVKYNL